MTNRKTKLRQILCLCAIWTQALGFTAEGQPLNGSSDDNESPSNELLLSGRMETIYLIANTRIREDSSAKSRFYFNNIFLNLEGSLGKNTDFIIEFQPLTSDLYLLGGYLSIAEALEGIGVDEEDARKTRIDSLITNNLMNSTRPAGDPVLNGQKSASI